MNIIQVTPGLLPIPPNGWGAIEKIIWDYKISFEKLGHRCKIEYLDYISDDYDVLHIHVANLALQAYEKRIPYYFSMHDHHAFLYGKNSELYHINKEAIKHSIKSFVPSKYLVDYFDEPNLQYLSHGVNLNRFQNNTSKITSHSLLCVANNGFNQNKSYDRKGFSYAIEAAKALNLPITIVGPENNKHFFSNYDTSYSKLQIKYDLSEKELVTEYQNHTMFLHPSELEAGHPNLTLLEAMASGLPVVGTYEDNTLEGLYPVTRTNESVKSGIEYVINNYDSYKVRAYNTAKQKSWDNIVNELIMHYTEHKGNMKDELLNLYKQTSITHRPIKTPKNKLILDFNQNTKVEIAGPLSKKYNIEFIDSKTKKSIFKNTINNNMWCAASPKYFIDWNIKVTELDTGSTFTYEMDLKSKNIKIINESPSLGDYVASMGMVDLFQKTYNCNVDFYTPRKELFEKSYPNISFYNYDARLDKLYYATYAIGCFDSGEYAPKSHRELNLQENVAMILGLDWTKDIKPNIFVKNKTRVLSDKYVCISTASTMGCKHWQNKSGWQKTVDYLNSLGYKVVVLQKESLTYNDLTGLNNVIHPNTESLDDLISWLYNCEFFIGLSSGNSWLAWALNKKVILISGFSLPFTEFQTPYRVINKDVCIGCWNDISLDINGEDWNWCPYHKGTSKQFICSKKIGFDMVKQQIDNIHM